MDFLNNFEIPILDFIAKHIKCDFLDVIMPYITSLADAGIFWIALAVVLLFFKKTRKAAIMMLLALVMGLVCGNVILKPLIGRIRPYDWNPNVTLLIERLTDGSFPSGHTLASFEAAGVLMMKHRKTLGYPAIVLAIIIAFSRLYLYVHYPTDVLCGIILGLAFAFFSCKIIEYLFQKFQNKIPLSK